MLFTKAKKRDLSDYAINNKIQFAFVRNKVREK